MAEHLDVINPESSLGQLVLPLGVLAIHDDLDMPSEGIYMTFNQEVDRLMGRQRGESHDAFISGPTIVKVARRDPSGPHGANFSDPAEENGVDRGIQISGLLPGNTLAQVAFGGRLPYRLMLQTHERQHVARANDTPPIKAHASLGIMIGEDKTRRPIHLDPLAWYNPDFPGGNPHTRRGGERSYDLDRMFNVGGQALRGFAHYDRVNDPPVALALLKQVIDSYRASRVA